MDFSAYQEFIKETALYPNRGNNVAYPVLGLLGEAGEVADKVKKIIRDNNGVVNAERKEELVKELGDVLWYLAALTVELDVSLNDVAEKNISKLRDRKKRGVLKGEGDNR